MKLVFSRMRPRWAAGFLSRVKAAFRRLIRTSGSRKPHGLARLQGCLRLPRRLILFYDIPDQSSLAPEDRFDPRAVYSHWRRAAEQGAEVAARIRQTQPGGSGVFQHDHLIYLGAAGRGPGASRRPWAVLRLGR